MKLNGGYEENTLIMDRLFRNNPTVKSREIRTVSGIRCRIYFGDGLVATNLIRDGIIAPVMGFDGKMIQGRELDIFALSVIQLPEVQKSSDTVEMEAAVAYGDALLFVEGAQEGLIIGCKGFSFRSLQEPEEEKVSQGPREGFVEPVMINISMLKRRLRTSRLKIEVFSLGGSTRTTCCLCYLEGTAPEDLVSLMRQRISKIRIDGVLSSNYVCEMIDPSIPGLFRRVGTTARPDVASAALLEGRVAILLDGCPQALTAPFVFIENFQSPEDYYVPYHQAVFARALRLFAFFAAISLVPVYIAVLSYHPGTLSTKMMINIAMTQEATPFSAVGQALLFLLSFDLLREAGLRTPSSIGQSLSIVGALILGQSAVEANIVSPSMVIIVALSGVTGLAASKLKNQIIILRLILLLFSQLDGLWGFVMGISLITGRLAVMESFGVDYLSSMPFISQGSHEDSLMRKPFSFMKKYGRFISKRRGG